MFPLTPVEVEDLFQRALDCEPTERRAFIRNAANGNTQLRDTVQALLDALEQADSAKAWDASAFEHVATATPLDRYRLLERIGAGGMAVVYKAARSDDEFSKLVAIKLVLTRDPGMLARFRQERQVLASLEHPNIARLLDGGTSADGTPFLVMEYVDGPPVHRYVTAQHLSLPQIIELFRKICSAVAYAHRKLVVHRDLKPANILVAEGEPRLLDFGIARLLGESSGGTSTRAMTPEYASPEQVRGDAVGLAADIYSLGVLLYELLTGKRPYRNPESPLALADAIVNRLPEPLPAQFGHDLQKIVEKALAKEPERRYHSAEQFSEDLRRYLEGYPVEARSATAAYRIQKFVWRNKLAVGAALILVVTIAAGVVATAREAAIANRRFRDIRTLAHSVLFDYHDSIAALPGSTAVRQRLVKDGLEYLDRLSREADGDQSLMNELAGAYIRVGDVQGRPLHSNLGDTKGAIESYRRAIALLDRLEKRDPGDASVVQMTAIAFDRFARAQVLAGNAQDALGHEQKAVATVQHLCTTGTWKRDIVAGVDAGTNHEECRDVLADLYIQMGRVEGSPAGASLGDAAAAERWYRMALALYDAAHASAPQLTTLGSLHSDLGGMLTNAGKQQEALTEYRRALEIDERLNTLRNDTTVRRELAISHHNVGVGLLGTKDFEGALEQFHAAGKILDELVEADPKDLNIRINHATNTRRTAEALYRAQRYAEAAPVFRDALAAYDRLSAADPANASLTRQRGTAYLLASLYYEKLKEPRQMLTSAQRAASIYEPMQSDKVNRELLARSCLEAGKAFAIRGDWKNAQRWLHRSVDLWHSSEREGGLSPSNAKLAAEAGGALTESRKHADL